MNIEIKPVCADDYELAFVLTRELIEYHNLLDIFELTQERLSSLLGSGEVMSLIAYGDGAPAGIMNYFWKYTTFTGKKILYIEDLYTRSEFRGCGIGKRLIESAKAAAARNDCDSIELTCADWNCKSAGFYESLGMKQEKDWITYTLDKSLF
ncbi:MAG: GNAT family N-acetyltransferase [Ruminococcus sp.]|nr:GNAT family N-acetyltransferase [Ruminococcus sp.]